MFEDIRFFDKEEVEDAINDFGNHPYTKAMMDFCFGDKSDEEKAEVLKKVKSVELFQKYISYPGIGQIINSNSTGYTITGMDNIKDDTAYLLISNHRDILLDSGLMNFSLFEHNKIMTASAIGDNLVKDPFVNNLSRLNRNFLIKRNVSPRKMLENSLVVSKYIESLLKEKNQTVWIAQREGRAKDGNDKTMPGVLKMIAMVERKNPIEYLKSLKIIPFAASYEFDPMDIRKVKELTMKELGMEYIKSHKEDFESIIWSAIGRKGKMQINIGEPLSTEFDAISQDDPINKQINQACAIIDEKIQQLYHLHSSNWIAYDILNGHKNNIGEKYTQVELDFFLKRMEKRQDKYQVCNTFIFLKMYARPVFNQLKEEVI